MPRNLVICCDGTNNQFGENNTNVVRLVQALLRDPDKQRLYYDPGVGTLPEVGALTRLGKWLSKVRDLAFGAGVLDKVGGAYSYLMDYWEPGDRVYLFGFSRGAYTVRVLAGLLYTVGLLPRGAHNLVPYVLRLFKGVRQRGADADSGATKTKYWDLCDNFRQTFSRPAQDKEHRHFGVHFMGLWDTVSSVGWVWDPTKFPYTARNPGISTIRHAISIDERRAFFRQNQMHKSGNQDLLELWFPGVHCDVGGGYPEVDGWLWRAPFEWILDQAETAELCVDPERRKYVLGRPPISKNSWCDKPHESLTAAWWIAEFFPKLSWFKERNRRLPRLNIGRHRWVSKLTKVERSALLCIRDNPEYRPPNLPAKFINRVIAMDAFPPWIEVDGE